MEENQLRVNRLCETERRRVTWRHFEPLERPSPRPFDLEACLKIAHAQLKGGVIKNKVELPVVISKKEAWFWLVFYKLMLEQKERVEAAWLDEMLRREGAGRPRELSTMYKVAMRFSDCSAILLSPFLDYLQLAELSLNSFEQNRFVDFKSYRLAVLPFLSNEQRNEVKVYLKKVYDQEVDPQSARAKTTLKFLSIFGGGHRLAHFVASEPDNDWCDTDWSEFGMEILLGLPDEASFVREAKRLVGGVEGDLRVWLLATEWRELAPVEKAILALKSKSDAEEAIATLGQIVAPETAAVMVRLQKKSKASRTAEAWLKAHPL